MFMLAVVGVLFIPKADVQHVTSHGVTTRLAQFVRYIKSKSFHELGADANQQHFRGWLFIYMKMSQVIILLLVICT